MSDPLRPFIIAIVTGAILAGLSWLFARAKPAVLSGESGTIRPERWSAWFTVIVGTLMSLMATWAAIYGDAGLGAVAAALLGAAAAGFMAPSLTSVHAVHWNADQIEGPSKIFGPTLGVARTAIKWSDIAATDSTVTGYWYVQSNDGRRVYWSYLYKGHGALRSALERNCPSLFPADDEV